MFFWDLVKLINMVNMQKQILKYFCIGLICVCVDLLFYCFAIYSLKLESALSNFISSHIGILFSFYLNSKYNFDHKGVILHRFIPFYIVGFIGYVFGHLFLSFGLSISSYRSELIKGSSYIGIFAIQFTLNKIITFGIGWKEFRLYILKYIARNNMLNVGFDLSKEAGSLEIISESLGCMELLFQFVLVFSLFTYIFLANMLKILSFGSFGFKKSFLIFSKLIPFNFAIRWLRSYTLMSYGEILESN